MIMKRIIRYRLGFYCCFALLFGFMGCIHKSQKVKLLVDMENSIVVEPLFVYDSITVNNLTDTIIFTKYSNGRPFIATLVMRDSNFYEIRNVFDMDGDSCFVATLMTLSKKDTSYDFERGYIVLEALSLQFSCMHYEFTKEGGSMYKTLKRSLQDSTYTEIFYYNDNYQISKFINTWRDNKIVYVPENKKINQSFEVKGVFEVENIKTGEQYEERYWFPYDSTITRERIEARSQVRLKRIIQYQY